MCESTKYATRTIASLLNVIAFCWFVNFWMKLLLRSGVAILTIVTSFTISWLAPFFAMFYIWTWRGSAMIKKIGRVVSWNTVVCDLRFNRTCNWISVDFVAYPCYCDIADMHILVYTNGVVACTAQFYNLSKRGLYLAISDLRSLNCVPCPMHSERLWDRRSFQPFAMTRFL